jgi:calpain-7
VDLNLSDAQKGIFAGWRRVIEQTHSDEQRKDDDAFIMTKVHEPDLVQDVTTDCSVVASLCAGTARVSKGHQTVFLFTRLHQTTAKLC